MLVGSVFSAWLLFQAPGVAADKAETRRANTMGFEGGLSRDLPLKVGGLQCFGASSRPGDQTQSSRENSNNCPHVVIQSSKRSASTVYTHWHLASSDSETCVYSDLGSKNKMECSKGTSRK